MAGAPFAARSRRDTLVRRRPAQQSAVAAAGDALLLARQCGVKVAPCAGPHDAAPVCGQGDGRVASRWCLPARRRGDDLVGNGRRHGWPDSEWAIVLAGRGQKKLAARS